MLKRGLIILALVVSGATVSAVAVSPTAYAATCNDESGKILTLKPWYYGLVDEDCAIMTPSDMGENGLRMFVSRIILTVVEDLLQLVGYATVGFIIYGGFIYMTSSGAPDKAARGQKMVMNAMIGLFIAMASIALVNFIGSAMGMGV